MDTNISIIQLIKIGKIDIHTEISNIRAGKGINIYIRTYLEKSDQYAKIQFQINRTKEQLSKEADIQKKLHFDEKLQKLIKVEQDFIANTIYLADTLGKIGPKTERLKKVIEYFEQGKIKEADEALNEGDMLNDQYTLIIFVEYQEHKIKKIRR